VKYIQIQICEFYDIDYSISFIRNIENIEYFAAQKEIITWRTDYLPTICIEKTEKQQAGNVKFIYMAIAIAEL
jgi:hypothetical protein